MTNRLHPASESSGPVAPHRTKRNVALGVLSALYAAGPGRGIALEKRYRRAAARLIGAGYAVRLKADDDSRLWCITAAGAAYIEARAKANMEKNDANDA